MKGEIGFRVRGRVGAIFLARHAISPEDAIDFSPEARDVREFDRLRAGGVVRDVGDGRHWFDLPAYFVRDRVNGRRVAIWAFVAAVLGAAVAMLFYRG